MPRKKNSSLKIDSLSSLKTELQTMDHVEFPRASSSCIYRVPPKLRKMNEAAYTPIMVSIGPYHHGNKRFKSMEEVKLWYLHKFLKRAQHKSLDDYIYVLRDQESEIQRCYSETIPMKSDEFVRMILTDACFIIEYFLQWLDADHWYSKLWSWETTTDLILLENQLPFFVLKKLFDQTFPDYDTSFEFVIFSCFNTAFNYAGTRFTFTYFLEHHLLKLPDGTFQVHHLCDMLRIFYVRLDQQLLRALIGGKMKPVYNASKLHDAGIKFEVNEDEINLLELKYSKGVLKIPRIMVFDHTEIMLRNLVAFEQCHSLPIRNMTDYIILLEHLISTGKDAEILVEKGIIQNFLGESDAVASITKTLGRHTTYTSNFNGDYKSLFEELNNFYDSSYYKYIAIFKQRYWGTPLITASFSVASMVLLFTLIQTISSIIGLFQN